MSCESGRAHRLTTGRGPRRPRSPRSAPRPETGARTRQRPHGVNSTRRPCVRVDVAQRDATARPPARRCTRRSAHITRTECCAAVAAAERVSRGRSVAPWPPLNVPITRMRQLAACGRQARNMTSLGRPALQRRVRLGLSRRNHRSRFAQDLGCNRWLSSTNGHSAAGPIGGTGPDHERPPPSRHKVNYATRTRSTTTATVAAGTAGLRCQRSLRRGDPGRPLLRRREGHRAQLCVGGPHGGEAAARLRYHAVHARTVALVDR
jgi:hypothetical protein